MADLRHPITPERRGRRDICVTAIGDPIRETGWDGTCGLQLQQVHPKSGAPFWRHTNAASLTNLGYGAMAQRGETDAIPNPRRKSETGTWWRKSLTRP